MSSVFCVQQMCSNISIRQFMKKSTLALIPDIKNYVLNGQCILNLWLILGFPKDVIL